MNTKSIQTVGSFGPLSPYIKAYLVQVKEQGYAFRSICGQVCALRSFGRWLKRTGRVLRDLNESVIRDYLRRWKTNCSTGSAPATLRRLLMVLRRIGATPEAEAAQPTPSEQLIHAYERFLLEQRNLAPPSVTHLRLVARRFLSGTFDTGPLNFCNLRAPDITTFVQRDVDRHGRSYPDHLVGGMRAFLRYLHYKGLINGDLSLVVPRVPSRRLSTVPKYLSAAQVRQLLHHCDRSTPLGQRNYAILLLLARLGLRAGEVVRLNLEDIDWENARITVCGKGQKWAQLPLPADAARATAQYLRRARPRCACRRVFIRHCAPIGGLDAKTVATIVKCALAKAGVPSVRKGAHLLRHSLATEMLRKGASLDEIGEVLRHKSRDSTALYAKVDINSLRRLALPWPGGAR